MKFVLSWTALRGTSAKTRRRELRRSLDGFVRWLPPNNLTFREFVVRADGGGGFAVVETDAAADLLDGVARFSPWFEFEVFAVVEIADAVGVLDAAANWLDFVNPLSDVEQQSREHKKKNKQQKKDEKQAKKHKKRAKKLRKRKKR
jgi:uncharacterized protein DUF3303